MPNTNVGGVVLGELVLGRSATGGGGGSGAPTQYGTVAHTLNLKQSVTYTNTKVLSIFSPYQTITYNIVGSKSVTSNLNLTHSVVGHNVRGVSQNLSFTQDIVAYASKGVKNEIAWTQSIQHNNILNMEIVSNLNWQHNAILTRTKALHVQQAFGMVSTVQKQKVLTFNIDHTLALTQEIVREVHRETVLQNLALTQTVAYTPVYSHSITNTLNLTQSIGLNRVINCSVVSNLVFLPTRQVYVGMGDVAYYIMDNIQYVLIPAYQVGKKNNPHCVLQVANAAITLPAPDWGDTENYGGVFTIRRSMNGVPYTHVRSLSLRKLKLPWTLAKRKAWELREFLLQYNASLMTLTTWKGDKWFVNLLTNPFELIVSGRYEVEHERVQVELEFEGLKVM